MCFVHVTSRDFARAIALFDSGVRSDMLLVDGWASVDVDCAEDEVVRDTERERYKLYHQPQLHL